jgi:ankyrin repeat protein
MKTKGRDESRTTSEGRHTNRGRAVRRDVDEDDTPSSTPLPPPEQARPEASRPVLNTRSSDNTTTTTTTTRNDDIAGPPPAESATTAPKIRVTASNMFAALLRAISDERVDDVARLLKDGAKVNFVTTNGKAPLHLAAKKGRIDIVGLLLQNGAQVDMTWREGPTALIVAAEEGHVELAALLLKHGAKVDFAIGYRGTPLTCAAENGHVELAALLLKHGAKVDLAGKYSDTPLTSTAKKGHLELAALLLKHGAKVDLTRALSATPLAIAAENGHVELAELLLRHGANVNFGEHHYFSYRPDTALYKAAEKGHEKLVALLLKNGAKVNCDDETPLCVAAERGHLNIVSALILQNKSDLAAQGFFAHSLQSLHSSYVDRTDFMQRTPLHLAIDNNHLAVATVLVASGARVDLPNHIYGNTALHLAVKRNNLQAVALLLQAKSNALHKNKDGQTALYLALSSSDASSLLIDLLLEAASSGQTNSLLFGAGKIIDMAKLADQSCTFMMNLHQAETSDQASAWRALINDLCTTFGMLHIVAEGFVAGLRQMPAHWPGLNSCSTRPTAAQVRMFYRHALASAQRLHALGNEHDPHRAALYQSQFTPPATVTLIRLAATQSRALIADSETAQREWKASLGRFLDSLPATMSAAEIDRRLQGELGLHPSLAGSLTAIWTSLETKSTARLIQAMHQQFSTAEFSSTVIEPVNDDMLRFMLMEQLNALSML